MDEVDVAGRRVAYRRAGRGDPLVLLHGVLGDSRDWQVQLDGLADSFDVVAWDAPGCGSSDDPPEDLGADGYVAALVGLLDALGLARPHVLGLSWGSALALELCRVAPARVRSLVLASAYAGWKGSLRPDEVARRREQCLRESHLPAEEFVPEWVPSLFGALPSPEVVDATVATMSSFHPVGYRAMVLAFADLDLRPVLPTIGVPTLLVAGALDQRSPVDVARAMHAQIPGSQLVVLAGAGHLSNVEVPDAFDAAVRAFLADG